ncbi:MAG: FecR domain-containing protein [Parabacteroides merdae]
MNTITVPAGQRANLTLPDGTNVWLNARSEMRYPAVFTGQQGEINWMERLISEVTHNEDKPLLSRRTNVMSRCWERNLTWRHTVTPRISVRH